MDKYTENRLLEIELRVNNKIITIKSETIDKINNCNQSSGLIVPVLEMEIEKLKRRNKVLLDKLGGL